MEGDKRLSNIEMKIDRQSEELADIKQTLATIAVQDQRLHTLEQSTHTLWKKYDELASPEGIVQNLKNFQASCPRFILKWVWVVLIPMMLTQVIIAIELVKLIRGVP